VSRSRWRERREQLRAQVRDGWKRLAGGELTPAHAGWSVFAGTLIGATPLLGLHLVLTLLVCLPLRLDALVAYLVTQVCNPILTVWLWWAELELGSWMRTGHGRPLAVEQIHHAIGAYVVDFLYGALVLTPALAAVLGLATSAWVASRSARSRRAPNSSAR
jgi:uncharacterized protein (DUF2062 family)